MSEYKASVDVFGDKIEVEWNGNVWVAPTCGAQFASRRDAMETELQAYFEACGDSSAEITAYLDEMDAADDEPEAQCECACDCTETATTTDEGVPCCDECSEYITDVGGDVVCARMPEYDAVVASGGFSAAEKKKQDEAEQQYFDAREEHERAQRQTEQEAANSRWA